MYLQRERGGGGGGMFVKFIGALILSQCILLATQPVSTSPTDNSSSLAHYICHATPVTPSNHLASGHMADTCSPIHKHGSEHVATRNTGNSIRWIVTKGPL